ncbi:MAG: sialate O-acetylesterase [Bacteroidaceae bacterium]|nr:sialate O-acetylesterase [Bacteroidaceae bacterium]
MKILVFLLSILLASPTAYAAKAKKTVKPLRVACVGNSVTYGYGLHHRDRDAYPVRLQALLDSAFGVNRYEVGNFGHSGATLLYKGHRPYIKLPEFHQALDFRPDWVVIHLGLNDTDPRNWPDWKEEFIPNYRALIDSFLLVNPEARVLICRMTPIFDRHPRFRSGTRDWHQQVQEAIERVARGARVQLIDLWEPLHMRPDLFPDALHPNPEGAKILAKTVYGALTGDFGGLQLSPIYGKGMVLQRDEPLTLHGLANTNQTVTVRLAGEGATAVPASDGTWKVHLKARPAGGPYRLEFSAKTAEKKAKPQIVVLDSVFFGDVWLASGQSNMELRVDQVESHQQDLTDAAKLKNLHLFNMPARARTDAVEWPDSVLAFTNRLQHMDMQGWTMATPEAVKRFSAIAFNFARVLSDNLTDVPIGIICNAVGGSTTESWIDRTTLEYELPDILRDWRNGDFGQAWARGRMTQNIAHALDKESPAYNPLQRHPYEPCYLFEAAIRPLQQFPIKGVLWYQGESNAHNLELHTQLFSLLEKSWRCEWGRADLPFYFVQLSSLNRPSWPAFRDSQRKLAEQLPNTWMVVSSDVGDIADVHYRNKRPVGERLALQALHHTYGRQLVSEGPRFNGGCRVREEDASVVLSFDNADGMTVSRGFELAADDGIYHPAQATVEGQTVVLRSPNVTRPAFVRYAWQPFTDADLRNRQGLPASTFSASLHN